MAESSTGSTPTKTITRISVSPCSKEQICLICAKEVVKNDYRRRLIGPGSKKTKACLDLEILAGRQFSEPELTTNIICRNCADKNDTIVKKVNLVRDALKAGHDAIAAQKGSTTSTKRLSSDASGSATVKRSLRLQDAPDKLAASEQDFLLLTRDASTQADLSDLSEEESFVEVRIRHVSSIKLAMVEILEV